MKPYKYKGKIDLKKERAILVVVAVFFNLVTLCMVMFFNFNEWIVYSVFIIFGLLCIEIYISETLSEAILSNKILVVNRVHFFGLIKIRKTFIFDNYGAIELSRHLNEICGYYTFSIAYIDDQLGYNIKFENKNIAGV